jgi:hypothetical protein
MMKKLSLLLTSIISITLFSCGPRVEGNGNVTTKEHEIGNATNLDISGQFVVEIKQGKNSNLTLEVDDNLHEYIDVKLENNTVQISTEAFITDAEELNIYVTMHEFDNIDISGAVQLETSTKIKTDYLAIDASGASEIDVNINVKELTIEISGASETVLSGKADNVDIEATGASEIEAFKLSADHVSIDISGAVNAEVNAKKSLEVEISGAGEIRYKGNPKIEKNISGAGSIKRAK